MDSINNGATIRIGFREYDKNSYQNIHINFFVPTYSLKIDKKSVLICGCAGPSKDYLNIYKEAAIEIASLMKERGIKEYIIFNGERVRMSNKKWESCSCVPSDGEVVFRKTLDEFLN